MEGRRCRNVIWGSKELWVLWRGRSPGLKGRRNKRGISKGKHWTKAIDWKMRGVDFCEVLKPAALKVWNFSVCWFGWDRALRLLPYLWREVRQTNLGQIVRSEDHVRLKKVTLFAFFLECICERWCSK